MTNKEIEKRFLFDLEMGRFKTSIHLRRSENPLIEIFCEDKNYIYNIPKMVQILIDNGFYHLSKVIYDTNPTCFNSILINTKNKNFECICNVSISNGVNICPDYIDDYLLAVEE